MTYAYYDVAYFDISFGALLKINGLYSRTNRQQIWSNLLLGE